MFVKGYRLFIYGFFIISGCWGSRELDYIYILVFYFEIFRCSLCLLVCRLGNLLLGDLVVLDFGLGIVLLVLFDFDMIWVKMNI